MEYNVLGFPDAMKLAEIIHKYIVDGPQTEKFVEQLLQEISPEDFANVLYLLSPKNDISKMSGKEAYAVMQEGLEINKLSSLLHTYTEFGKLKNGITSKS